MSKMSACKTIIRMGVFCVLAAVASPAQDEWASATSVKFTSIFSFNGSDGYYPFYAPLVQGLDGNLYGTTAQGGAYGGGTVFKVTPGGSQAVLYSFCAQPGCTDGNYPQSGVVLATDGNFYGTTFEGGASQNPLCSDGGCGTVFKITPTGTLTTLYSFCAQTNCIDGSNPASGVIQASDGNFYGTTYIGGANCIGGGSNGCGTIFRITPSATLTTLYNFCSDYVAGACYDGEYPYDEPLLQATNGNFYGATAQGGCCGDGAFFEVTPTGKLTTLAYSNTLVGSSYGGLIQASNGNFYGTGNGGGAYGVGNLFEMTPAGKLTLLHSFDGADGSVPYAGLVQATDGNLYGTTSSGGANTYYGIAFKITPGGTLTTLHSFDSTDGAGPEAGLVQATNGELYGTTAAGGIFYCGQPGCGTVFSLSVGLGSFVETNPTSGKAGAAVKILGNNLTGSTSVTFNGIPASFTAHSTYITTSVPTGATTGYVEVTTASGKILTSNVKFRVP